MSSCDHLSQGPGFCKTPNMSFAILLTSAVRVRQKPRVFSTRAKNPGGETANIAIKNRLGHRRQNSASTAVLSWRSRAGPPLLLPLGRLLRRPHPLLVGQDLAEEQPSKRILPIRRHL